MKRFLIDRLRGGVSPIILTGSTWLRVGVLVLCGLSSLARAQDLAASNSAMEEMRTAAGGELRVLKSARTGLANFVAAPRGAGIPVRDRSAITASDRALSFVEDYGRAFGLHREGISISRVETDDLGMDHVRMRQVVAGVPVTGGELVVHMRGRQVLAANGKTLDGLQDFGVVPTVASNEAESIARAFVTRRFDAPNAILSEPRLEVFNQAVLGGKDFPTRLAWFLEASDLTLREFIWIDATNRMVLLHFSQRTDARNRAIYNGNNVSALPGTLMRSEGGGATGDADADKAYDFSGHTYDYFFTNHARDSYNGAGAQLVSTVHHCPGGGPCPYPNAFWNGQQMVYGNGFSSADDVVAHELTHAVTEYSANLFYYMQSGALNESFSDIFGETVDQGNGAGNDTPAVKWQMGEDLTGIGAIRNMMTPTVFSDPGKMSDPQFKCETDPFGQDAGGVHGNSGVPNHAYALMVDGGTYNGITVAGIGLTKAAKIQYRALTTYLTSSSDFLDNYNALQQACSDLVGTAGITSGNCAEVKKALDAVQMSSNWPCTAGYGENSGTPALCSAASSAVISFFDGFESGLGNWVISGTAGTPLPLWARTSSYWGSNAYATTGTDSLWGYNQPVQSESTIGLAGNLTIPPGARLQFNHSFGFENDVNNWDGGRVEYSTNGGGTWNDLFPLHAAGATYHGAISNLNNNPLAGLLAFVKDSFGYTASQYNLLSLAGQTQVRFRFRIGTDSAIDDYGWFIDDFRVYTCVAPAVWTGAASEITNTGATLNGTVNPNGVATSGSFEYGLTSSYGSTTSSQSLGSGSSVLPLTASMTGLTACTTYHFRATAQTTAGVTNGLDSNFITAGCQPPTVTTGVASAIRETNVILNGTLNPNGTTSFGWFEYGSTTSYGFSIAPQPLGSGAVPVPFASPVFSGSLSCNMSYHFRAVGTNPGGTTYGSDATFTTSTCRPPWVDTLPASAIGPTGATLNGTVTPTGSPTTGSFEYGLTASYGSATAPQGLGSDSLPMPLGATISGLTCGTLYHFRAKATNTVGTEYGSDATFITSACLPPAVSTLPASAIGATGATLNGTVVPRGTPTVGSFEFGLTTAYGNATAPQSLGSGSLPLPLSATIGGLTCGRVYHFRPTATNTGGTATGSDATFTTVSCPVQWTHVVGVVATGNSLSKIGGTTDWNAGAISVQTLPSGDGQVEFTATETNAYRAVGLGTGDASQSYIDIEYAIVLTSTGAFLVYESGTARTGAVAFSAGDKFSVGVESGIVKYRRNGVLFYSSLIAPVYPLVVDTALYNIGATVTDARILGFFEPPPTLTVNDVSTTEGNSGSVNAVFTVTLSPASLSTVTVVATTADNTALAGSDYTATGPTTLTFAPGALTQTFSVPVLGDAVTEPNETFFVNLTSPANAVIGDAQGVGTILNDDLPPAVQWTHVVGVVATGNSLSKASGTTNWTAGAISVQTLPSGDGQVEFTATETNTYRAVGLGTGDSSQSYIDIEYGVVLASTGTFLVYESGTARTGAVAFSAGDKFSVGVESGVVKYRRNGLLFYSSLIAPVYPLIVDTSLYNIGATITDARILGFVEPPPTLTINDVSVTEGNSGALNAVFTVTLSPASLSTVTVVATTADNTALAGSDYTATGPTTLTFSPGVLTQTFSVPALGDAVTEPNETFLVNLTSPTNAVIGDAQGAGTILNDDLPPAVQWTHVVGVVATGNSLSKTGGPTDWTAGAISVQTLASGDGSVEFTATETNTYRAVGLGTGDSSQSYIDIEYGVVLASNGTFLVYESGTARTGSVAFSAGDKFSVGVESGAVKYRRNGVPFYSSLIAPVYPLVVDTSLYNIGATVTDARILGFLEPPPTLAINDVSVTEGNSGSVNAVFTVTLSPASLSTVTVVATTANNTALAGSDYTATGPITLTFSPGVLTQTFSVPVLGDAVTEPNETFLVNLTSATNAVIGDAQGVGTILNDDLPPPVTWTHVVGVVATGNSLSKITGTTDWNAGAISLPSLPSGDGSVEFTATETNTYRMVGLGTGDSSQSYVDIEYGIVLASTGTFLVYESGTARTGAVAFSAGDKFSVGVESGAVKYRRNGVLFYSSLIAPVYPLVVDTALYNIGATVTDARILGFVGPPIP